MSERIRLPWTWNLFFPAIYISPQNCWHATFDATIILLVLPEWIVLKRVIKCLEGIWSKRFYELGWMRDDVKIVFLFKIKVEPSMISSLFGTSSIIIPCRLIEFYNLPSNSDVY